MLQAVRQSFATRHRMVPRTSHYAPDLFTSYLLNAAARKEASLQRRAQRGRRRSGHLFARRPHRWQRLQGGVGQGLRRLQLQASHSLQLASSPQALQQQA